MFRDDCDALLRHVLASLDGPVAPPPLDVDRLAAAGLGTGLTAAIGALHEHHGVATPHAWRVLVDEQRAQVAARHERFAAATPTVLRALDAAGIDAIPVKGLVLATEHWPVPAARPMADIDLLVAPAARERAAGALVGAGFATIGSSPWEDVFRVWGDGSVDRVDGESIGHDGKLEVHPGWVERLHHYLVDDHDVVVARARAGTLLGAPCRRLDPAGFAAHVLGHLAASVVRCEVRALNVVDAVVVARGLDAAARAEWLALAAELDPRLVAPGAWLVHAYAPDAGLAPILDASLPRLPAAARGVLASTTPSRTFRTLGTRTDWAWRRAFAATPREQAAVLRQLVLPPAAERTGRGRRLAARVRGGR